MLYAFFGTDTIRVRKEAHDFLHEESELHSLAVSRIAPEQFSAGLLEDAAGSTSLFGGGQLYIIDTPSGNAEMFEFIFGNLSLFAESPNTFVLIEERLLAPEKKKLAKYAEQSVERVADTKAVPFNPFALSEALLRRDKKSLWLLLQEAKERGMPEEQIIGLLFAQLRALRLVARTKDAHESGMKPFVYTKAKAAERKYTAEEVDARSRSLIEVYHDGHLGTRDIAVALEKWVLTL